MTVCPAKTQISLGIRPVWSESLLCAQWVAKDPSFLHADSEDSDQTGRRSESSLGAPTILLVLSCRGSCEYEMTAYAGLFSIYMYCNTFSSAIQILDIGKLIKSARLKTSQLCLRSFSYAWLYVCSSYSSYTVKFLKNRTPKKFAVINLKFERTWLYNCEMCPKDVDRIANSVDPDQTALSENLGTIRYYLDREPVG